MPTIQQLAAEAKSPQVPIVENLIKALGVLETAQAGFSSDYLRHEYNVAAEDPSAAVRAVNGSIISSSGREILASITLPEISSLVEVDKSIVKKYGSIEAYLNQPNRQTAYIRKILQTLDQAMIYGNDATFGVAGAFRGFHQIAKANSKVTKQCGGTTGSRTSMFCVHWSPDEIQAVIPQIVNGLLVQAELLGGGTLQAPTASESTKARELVYGANYWINAALQAGHDYGIAAITQIDSTHIPTAADIDALIDAVKGMADGMTFLYMNRTGRRYLRTLKATMFVDTSNTSFNTQIAEWNNIPVILDESISSAETDVLD